VAVTSVIAKCREWNVPIFSFEQDWGAAPAFAVQEVAASGLADWVKVAIGGGSTICYRQWEGNVFADTDLDLQLQNRHIQNLVVVGADGGTCVKLTAVGCHALQHPSPAVQQGAKQRGYGVHTCPAALHTVNPMGLAWLAGSDVWCYNEMGM
jgi:nicotinamidase-related amidase